MNLGLAYWHMGQMRAAEEVLAEALEAGQVTGNLYAMLPALIFQGRVLVVRGQLREAAGYFERAIRRGGEMPINALAYMDLSTLHYEWNELDRSGEYLQKAILLCVAGAQLRIPGGLQDVSSPFARRAGEVIGCRRSIGSGMDEHDLRRSANGVPNGAGGTQDNVCDPTGGYSFTNQSIQNFGKILLKRGHRVVEFALKFYF